MDEGVDLEALERLEDRLHDLEAVTERLVANLGLLVEVNVAQHQAVERIAARLARSGGTGGR
jgi:hypothetical protein